MDWRDGKLRRRRSLLVQLTAGARDERVMEGTAEEEGASCRLLVMDGPT